MTTRLVFLVPGFFGFTSVGAISYFEDVEQTRKVNAEKRAEKDKAAAAYWAASASSPEGHGQ